MSKFSIGNPYFVSIIGSSHDLDPARYQQALRQACRSIFPFPTINLPQVVVATFYTGMPPQDIETDVTSPLERFFTLANGIESIESHSMLGVNVIRFSSSRARMRTPMSRSFPISRLPI